jgi:hypothetical protein
MPAPPFKPQRLRPSDSPDHAEQQLSGGDDRDIKIRKLASCWSAESGELRTFTENHHVYDSYGGREVARTPDLLVTNQKLLLQDPHKVPSVKRNALGGRKLPKVSSLARWIFARTLRSASRFRKCSRDTFATLHKAASSPQFSLAELAVLRYAERSTLVTAESPRSAPLSCLGTADRVACC